MIVLNPQSTCRFAIETCVSGLILSAALIANLQAEECDDRRSCSDPNHHQRPGMNNHHWPHLKEILQGPKPFADTNRNFWYGDKICADDHGHQWCDYAFQGDCYHDDWRTTRRWDHEKTADLHRRTRDHSLATEAAWCEATGKCQAGYVPDTSGTPLLNIPRPQSECGIPPRCWPMFGGSGLTYTRYAYRTPMNYAGRKASPTLRPAVLAAAKEPTRGD